MTRRTDAPGPGFHAGELLVQDRAGTRQQADRLVRMLDAADLTGGAATFLAQRTFVVVTARDGSGALWTSPLVGPGGFLATRGPQELHVAALPPDGDPLADLPADQDLGLIAIDFTRRRRLRVNGRLRTVDAHGLSVEVDQAYGNCPQYIQQRTLGVDASDIVPPERATQRLGDHDRLSDDDVAQFRAADTFFLGTTHPTRGADSSHRGGPAGFVRVEGDHTLWWPDYPGNNMFNSLGNIAVDPTSALLVVDFATGRVVQVTGRASVAHDTPGGPGDDGRTGRRVRFDVERAIATARPELTSGATSAYPDNPPLT